MRKMVLAGMAVALILPALPVAADPPPWAPAHGRRDKDRHEDRDDYREFRRDRDEYDEHHRHEHRVIRYDEEIYRGGDGRYYCHRSDGTVGLIAGAAIGGVVGNQLARGGSTTLGTILGAGAGALVGQAIDKNSVYCE